MKVKVISKVTKPFKKGQLIHNRRGGIFICSTSEERGELTVVALNNPPTTLIQTGDVLQWCKAADFTILNDEVILSND